jgi:hypothetical protein
VLVDLGAERLIAAQRGDEKIAVEIKSFTGPSAIHEMQMALGQYITVLAFQHPSMRPYTEFAVA